MQYKPEEIRLDTGRWINSGVFREEATKFRRLGYYCPDPKGTMSYSDYWDEQLLRCQIGYEVAGTKITGHHYEYLNFTEIEIVSEGEKKKRSKIAKKETKAPEFWDGDYDYYWSLEIAKNGLFNDESLATNKLEREIYDTLPEEQQAEEKQRVLRRLNLRVIPHPDYLDGGNHMIVGKSRRKGYSYKNAAICANTYNTVRKSLTVIGAFDKKYLYPNGTMGKASEYLSYLNNNTAYGKAREYVDKQEHRRASFKKTKEGMVVEAGYMSEIIALTFKDNPEVARGKDAAYVLLEEAGAFPNLKDSFNATAPGLTAGKFITGQILIFGTGGDMESGTADFAEMFYNPIQFGLMPFRNIWDANAEESWCGFFHPVYWNMEGFYDEQGNSDIEGAIAHELSVREKLVKASTSSSVLQGRVQEYPMNPSEAFLTVSTNDFPIVELRAQYNRVIANKLNERLGTPVYLTKIDEIKEKRSYVDDEGILRQEEVARSRIRAIPDLDNILEPLWTYKPKTKNLDGSVIIYESPVANPPAGLYKIGFDPYRQQNSTENVPSLASIYVYKSHHKFSQLRNTIVASYVGRPYDPDDVNRIAELLAEFYNAEIMYENEVTHVKDYFKRRNKLHLLALQPDAVITANTTNSKVKRTWGCHMTEKLKDAGEKYIKQWLLQERDFDGDGKKVLNLETINDPALLEELILYNRKGNFDRVMSFMMVMFQITEEELDKEYDDNPYKTSTAQDLLQLMKTQFNNSKLNLQLR